MRNLIVFFEKYPFMGVELLDLLNSNYYLLSYYDDDCYRMLKNLGHPVLTYGSTNYFKIIDSDETVATILSDKSYRDKIIKNNIKQTKALFFYMNKEIDRLCQKQKIKMALPSYNIQEKLGNKLFLHNICKRLDVEVNKTMNIHLSDGNLREIYKKCKNELSLPFVLQGSLGVSGEDTFIIKSFNEFTKLCKKFQGSIRASKYLKNVIPLSVHICITTEDILYEGPYIQIIGFEMLTRNPFQFLGNDTNQKMLPEEMKNKVKSSSISLALYAKKLGYRGILGVDFLWDKDSNRVFVQEINSRLVGLTRLLTGIQKEQKIVPHLIRHLNEFIPPLSIEGYSDKPLNLSKYDYSQLYIANNKDSIVEVKQYLSPGIYKIMNGNLIRTKNSLFLSDMDEDQVLINFSAYKGSKLKTDQLIARIILKETVLKKNDYSLNKNAMNVIALIKSYILN